MLLVAAAALIDPDGRVLLASRPEGKVMAGFWEFPGGKTGADETPETALARELKEELGIRACPACFAPAGFVTHPLAGAPPQEMPGGTGTGCDPAAAWEPDDPDATLLLLLYLCRRWVGTPQPQEGQRLRWVLPRALESAGLLPADLPLARLLQALL